MNMTKKIYILGNGDSAELMPEEIRKEREGKLIICNRPPFEVSGVYACCIGDFKMMNALIMGVVNLDEYEWILATRPKKFMEREPSFHIKHSHHIRDFYTEVPEYCSLGDSDLSATNFNCGHMATHYSATRHSPDEIHMFGFDSIFDHNMRSFTDKVLDADREASNSYRLLAKWRPIWRSIFKEFPQINFLLYHDHNNIKIDLPKNVKIVTAE